MMTSVFKREVASVEVTLVLLMVQPTATLLMDTQTISNSAVHAHATLSMVMACSVLRSIPTLGATKTMLRGTSALDLWTMALTTTLVVKPVLTILTSHSRTMAGVLVTTVMATHQTSTQLFQMMIVVQPTRMETVKVVDGLMLSTPTTDMLRKMTGPTWLATPITTAIET